MTEQERARIDLCRCAAMLTNLGLIGALEGNLSVRLSDNQILVTPSGFRKGEIKPDQLVLTTLDGDGEVSSEFAMHVALYQARPDCQAICHAHPPITTALGTCGVVLPDDLFPEAAIVLGSIALVPFALTGTCEVGQAIAPFAPNHKTFVLRNHGAVTLGKSIEQATVRMETLERVTALYEVALRNGKPQPVPAEAMEVLRHQYLNGDL